MPILAVILGSLMSASSFAADAAAFNQQLAELRTAVRGKRVGMITNPSGVGPDMRQTADILCDDKDTTITAFFSPEHGLRGDQQAGAKVADYIDPSSGIPVYSMYGASKAPSDEQLAKVDVMVYDIQDVGVRFYTVVWSMTYAMEACAKNHKPFILLDRPNPLGLEAIEGSTNPADYGLIGRKWEGAKFGVCTRYGMTLGEVAKLVNGEWLTTKADLTVIPIPGLTRSTTWEQTGRPWVYPSPNMPTLDTVRLYPGMCIFEGTNMSEGRGTTKPFEQIGAPWIDGVALAAAMNAKHLPGVLFRPSWFTPVFSKQKDERCGGVQVHIIDAQKLEPIRTALELLQTIVKMYPEKTEVTAWAGKLMGDPTLPEAIKTKPVGEIMAGWDANRKEFEAIRGKYLIYSK